VLVTLHLHLAGVKVNEDAFLLGIIISVWTGVALDRNTRESCVDRYSNFPR